MAKRNNPGCACCGCTFTFTIRDCTTNALISGAAVTVKDSGGSTVATCTTGAGGTCSVTLPIAGNYTAEVVKSGYTSIAKPVALFCGAGMTILLGVSYTLNVKGCNSLGLSGATVTLVGATDGETMTGTTDSAGSITFYPSKSQTFNYTASHARFVNGTGTFSGCGAVGVNKTLTVATGYFCYIPTATCVLPLPATLNWSNSTWGTSGTMTNSGGLGASWTSAFGGNLRNFAACPAKGCAAATGVSTGHQLDNSAGPHTGNSVGNGWTQTSGLNRCPATFPGPVGNASVTTTVTSFTCSPFSITATTNTADTSHDFGYCGTQSTITITE